MAEAKTGMDADQFEAQKKVRKPRGPRDPYSFDLFTGEVATLPEKKDSKLGKAARLVLEQLAAWTTEHPRIQASQVRASPPREVTSSAATNALVELRRRGFIRDRLIPEEEWRVGQEKTSTEVTEEGWLYVRNLNQAEARPANPAAKKEEAPDTLTLDALDEHAWMRGRVRKVLEKRSGVTVMHLFQDAGREPQDDREIEAAEKALQYAVESGWADHLPDYPQEYRGRTVQAFCSRIRSAPRRE